MSGNRFTRRLLGWLALLAPLPLPFNEVLEWPVLVLYALLVALFLRSSGLRTLPGWAMNLLGVAYLPVLLVDLRMVLFRGQLVQTVVHLCMFAVAVKLFALRGRRDLWQTFGAVFFLFLASMGTSVHPSVLLYLLLFAALTMAFLMRMAMSRVLASYGAVESTLAATPVRGFVILVTAAALVASAPLFALFPRLNSPYVGIRGTGTGTEIFSTGFTDEVSLEAIGLQRGNPEVAMRLRYEGRPPREIRLKGAAFDRYRGKGWRAAGQRPTALVSNDGVFQLADRRPRTYVDVWQQPLGSPALLLPVEAVDLETKLPVPVLSWDRGGAVSLWRRPSGVISFRVGLADQPVLTASPPFSEELEEEPTLDADGLSERAAALAAEVMGDGPPAQQVQRLLDFFARDFDFSLEFMGRTGDAPLDDFLFEARQGHCELFASAMVLMLRSRGIPARLIAGFLGADYNPLTGYYVVRQGNAHAWVEAHLEDRGWMVFDPTPPAGRPTAQGRRAWSVFRQAWDYVQFRWERYVLTYGFQDQASALWGLRSLWFRFQSWVAGRGKDSPATDSAQGPVSAAEVADPAAPVAEDKPQGLPVAALPLLVALVVTLVIWRRQLGVAFTATRAFTALRRSLERAGLEVSAATPPLELQRRAEERFPDAAEPTGHLIRFYLRESFGGVELAAAERRELADSLRQARREMGRRRRPDAARRAGV